MQSDIDIVQDKYIYMSEGALKGLCNKLGINLYFGSNGYDIATKTLPQTLSQDGYLKNFYHNLKPKEKKILKFIVNCNAADIEKAVKKKFHYEIVVATKNRMVVYVWWLELFLNNNNFDDYFKDIFLTFLSESRAKNDSNKTKKRETQRVDTAQDIKQIMLIKHDINGEAYPQALMEYEVVDSILNTQLLYSLCLAKKIKTTQQRRLTKVSERVLEQNFSDDFATIDYLNILINNDYLTVNKEIIPSSKFIKIMQKSGGEIIKSIFYDFLKYEKAYELEQTVFSYTLVRGPYVKFLRDMIIEIIKNQESHLWVNVDTVVDMIKLDAKTLKYITNDYDHSFRFQGNALRAKYNDIRHLKVVVRYFVKSFFGLLHQFGMCKLAYTEFQAYNKEDYRIIRDEHAGRYANIEYYRLSELGLFVLGLTKKYQDKNSYKTVLNEYTLEFKVENPNSLSDIFVKKIATETTPLKYKTDIKTFMKNINTKTEYKQIEASFLENVDGELPKNWKNFFMLLNERQESASVIDSSCILIKIENNREVLKLLASNKKLQEKILKADKMNIVVMKHNLNYVKKTLKEYGILI